MGSPFIKQAQVTADTTLVTSAETVAATLSGISTPSADARVDIRGSVTVLTGAGTTGVNVRLRRGADATGAIVGEVVGPTVAAGAQVVVPVEFQDVPGEVASQSYVITVAQVAATANGTVNNADIVAEVYRG